MIKSKNFCILFTGTITTNDCKQLDLYLSGLNLTGGMHSINVYQCISIKTNKPYALAKISFLTEIEESKLKESILSGKENGLISKNVIDAQQIRSLEAFLGSQKNNTVVYQRE